MMLLNLPNPAQEKILREKNNENVKTRDQDMQIIKNWLKQEPHLPDTLDDSRILTFLRGCKFSLEKTKQKLDMYFTLRGAVPELFSNRDVTRPELAKIFNSARFAPMPNLTEEGNRITIFSSLGVDFDTEDVANLIKITLMIGDVRLGEEIKGCHDIFVLDATIVQWGNAPKVPVSLLRKYLFCVQEAYPVRIAAVHVVNPTPLISLVIKWVTPFLKEKLRKRIFVHETLESLHKVVPKELLPEEYGGTCGKLEELTKKWMEVLEKYGSWFKEQEQVKTDESKRVRNGKGYDEVFGVAGSFKKLEID